MIILHKDLTSYIKIHEVVKIRQSGHLIAFDNGVRLTNNMPRLRHQFKVFCHGTSNTCEHPQIVEEGEQFRYNIIIAHETHLL